MIGRRTVREDVAEMGIAARAAFLDADHAVARVAYFADVGGIEGLGEARPDGAGFELASRPEGRTGGRHRGRPPSCSAECRKRPARCRRSEEHKYKLPTQLRLS